MLKRSGLSAKDLVTVYSTTIRPILEYAAPVWHTSLTKQQSDTIEHIQKRVLKIVFNCPYKEGLVKSGLTTLHHRRDQLIKDFFKKMQDPNHKLNILLPRQKTNSYSTRGSKKFEMPKCKTNRFKNSLIPYCLFNIQWHVHVVLYKVLFDFLFSVYTCSFIVIMLTFYHVYILLLLLSNTYVHVWCCNKYTFTSYFYFFFTRQKHNGPLTTVRRAIKLVNDKTWD